MTPEEAWLILRECVENDCGPYGEDWPSEELEEAQAVLDRLYCPSLTAKALFPENRFLWPPSDREGTHAE
jgi:hypothetical protein